jgi:hypothetical protein
MVGVCGCLLHGIGIRGLKVAAGRGIVSRHGPRNIAQFIPHALELGTVSRPPVVFLKAPFQFLMRIHLLVHVIVLVSIAHVVAFLDLVAEEVQLLRREQARPGSHLFATRAGVTGIRDANERLVA